MADVKIETLNQSELEHAKVLEDAFQIFRERDKQYGNTWEQFDAEDANHHLKSKQARIAHMLAPGLDDEKLDDAQKEVLIDSALDAINYATFIVRHVRAGRV